MVVNAAASAVAVISAPLSIPAMERIAGIHREDVRHRREGGQPADDLAAHGGAVGRELEKAFQGKPARGGSRRRGVGEGVFMGGEEGGRMRGAAGGWYLSGLVSYSPGAAASYLSQWPVSSCKTRLPTRYAASTLGMNAE